MVGPVGQVDPNLFDVTEGDMTDASPAKHFPRRLWPSDLLVWKHQHKSVELNDEATCLKNDDDKSNQRHERNGKRNQGKESFVSVGLRSTCTKYNVLASVPKLSQDAFSRHGDKFMAVYGRDTKPEEECTDGSTRWS